MVKKSPGILKNGSKKGAKMVMKSPGVIKKGSMGAAVKIYDTSGLAVGTVATELQKSKADPLKNVILVFDSSGKVVGEVGHKFIETTGDVAEMSVKGGLVVVDESGKAIGTISEEGLKASGMVVKGTKDGAVIVKHKAEEVSGADEAKTRKEYYQRLGYFFGPLALILLMFISYFLILPGKDALKLMGGQLGYLFAIPGFDPNTLILSANTFGINPYIMGLVIGIQDTIIGTFLVLNFDYVKRIPIVGKLIAEFEQGGKNMLEKYKWLNSFSVVGLFVFIVLPFQGFGPVAGAIIGRIIGIRRLYIIISIVVGSFVAVIALAYLADIIARYLPFWVQIGIPLTIAALLVSGFTYSIIKKKRKKKAEEEEEANDEEDKAKGRKSRGREKKRKED
jgi:uncharacterized membrane protein